MNDPDIDLDMGKKCCYCFGLQTGFNILGWIKFVLFIIFTLTFFLLCATMVIEQEVKKYILNIMLFFFLSFCFGATGVTWYKVYTK